MQYDFDIIIVGGGPAGATCALYAHRAGLKVLLVDKKKFPRDKICGDAIPGKCLTILEELGLVKPFKAKPKSSMYGVTLSSPNGNIAEIKCSNSNNGMIGHVCRRTDFDDVIFQAAKEKVTTKENFSVTDVLQQNGQVTGIVGAANNQSSYETYSARVVIGADGFKSIISRKTDLWEHDLDHWVVATRSYYQGIKGIDSSFEVHLLKDYVPGYFWIFPLADGTANVGLGMLHSELKTRKINLKEAHIQITKSSILSERFSDARLIGDIDGSNLPLGSKVRKAFGDGFILLGDAAGLIDPFTGEGIGNAMHSGKIAAEVLADVCKGEDYSASQLQVYQDRVWQEMGDTMRLSYKLQRLLKYDLLLNLLLRRCNKSKYFADWIAGMLVGQTSKQDFLTPKTIWRLLFA